MNDVHFWRIYFLAGSVLWGLDMMSVYTVLAGTGLVLSLCTLARDILKQRGER